MHGTGDHNVHFQGEEWLLNELVKYNRQFMFMPYPNRQHGISEGEGTQQHRRTMMANFLKNVLPARGQVKSPSLSFRPKGEIPQSGTGSAIEANMY